MGNCGSWCWASRATRDDGCVASYTDLHHDADCGTFFTDAAEGATAWFSVRDELMAGHGPGVRPAG
jgi:hypothetical protein